MKVDYYTLTYFCTNCDRRFKLDIPKGKLAPEHTTCALCGCQKTAFKGWYST